MDEDDVLIAVHEIHHRLGGVAEKKGEKQELADTEVPASSLHDLSDMT